MSPGAAGAQRHLVQPIPSLRRMTHLPGPAPNEPSPRNFSWTGESATPSFMPSLRAPKIAGPEGASLPVGRAWCQCFVRIIPLKSHPSPVTGHFSASPQRKPRGSEASSLPERLSNLPKVTQHEGGRGGREGSKSGRGNSTGYHGPVCPPFCISGGAVSLLSLHPQHLQKMFADYGEEGRAEPLAALFYDGGLRLQPASESPGVGGGRSG